MILALMLALSAAADPAPREVRVYGDWAVGCDNRRKCHATSLPDETASDEPVGDGNLDVSIKRDGARISELKVQLAFTTKIPGVDFDSVRWIAIDDSRLDLRLSGKDGVYDLNPADSAKLVAAMRGKSKLALLDRRRNEVGAASLRGLPQALGYMDHQQFLDGTIAALARPGLKAVNHFTVPPMLPAPVVRVAPQPQRPPRTLDAQELARLQESDPCPRSASEEPRAPPSYFRLDERSSLVMIASRCGGYNPTTVLFILRENGSVRLPRFWHPDGGEKLYDADLPDLWWDSKARKLNSFGRGRVLADCGEIQEYAWDGDRFELTHSASMPVCRGSRDYITTYRAEIRLMDGP